MSDHDFEKQVQQRLEQLKLRPSNAVWAEVERNIRLQKRRRRLLIWLPAALLIMIAGGYLALQQTAHGDMSSEGSAQAVVIPAPATTPVSPNQTPSTDNSTSTQANQPARDNNSTTPAQADPATDHTATPPATTDKPVQPAVATTTPVRKPGTDAPTVVEKQPGTRLSTALPLRSSKSPKNNTRRVQQQKAGDQAARKLAAAASLPVVNVPAPVTKQGDDGDKTGQLDTTSGVVPVTDSSFAVATPADSTMADTATALAAAPVTKTAPVVTAATVQRKKDKSKESKWQFGVNAEGGASGVSTDGLFGFLEKETAVPDLAAAPNYNYVGNSQAFAPQFPRPPVNRASSLSMGPSFSIGGFVQRKLNSRLSLSAGIQYTNLSARQVVGNKINNNRTVNRAPSTSQLVESYYDANTTSTTNKYTNKYHFLELPVTLHAQLNEGKRLPFGVDVGFSASRLLSTNALHYDGIGGVYYKDDALFNKTQWAASAGFSVKLFNQSNYPLSLGPVMRYNMTPMLVKDFSTGQHQWSVGLRASVLLKK